MDYWHVCSNCKASCKFYHKHCHSCKEPGTLQKVRYDDWLLTRDQSIKRDKDLDRELHEYIKPVHECHQCDSKCPIFSQV